MKKFSPVVEIANWVTFKKCTDVWSLSDTLAAVLSWPQVPLVMHNYRVLSSNCIHLVLAVRRIWLEHFHNDLEVERYMRKLQLLLLKFYTQFLLLLGSASRLPSRPELVQAVFGGYSCRLTCHTDCGEASLCSKLLIDREVGTVAYRYALAPLLAAVVDSWNSFNKASWGALVSAPNSSVKLDAIPRVSADNQRDHDTLPHNLSCVVLSLFIGATIDGATEVTIIIMRATPQKHRPNSIYFWR